MKKRSAHQTPRREKGLFKGFGYTDQHIWGQRNGFIGTKLVHFTLHATARHERAGYNWNVGILEHWNIGFWASGSESLRLREKMEIWVIVKFLFTGIKFRNIIFLKSAFHYSIIPLFHVRMKNISLKKNHYSQ